MAHALKSCPLCRGHSPLYHSVCPICQKEYKLNEWETTEINLSFDPYFTLNAILKLRAETARQDKGNSPDIPLRPPRREINPLK